MVSGFLARSDRMKLARVHRLALDTWAVVPYRWLALHEWMAPLHWLVQPLWPVLRHTDLLPKVLGMLPFVGSLIQHGVVLIQHGSLRHCGVVLMYHGSLLSLGVL